MSSQRSPFEVPASKRQRLDGRDEREDAGPQDECGAHRAARKPAFNPALLSSAFYSGPTMYGGAGAAALSRTPSARAKFYDRKKSIVRPAVGVPDNCMSRTSRRILDLLEQYSSPISDARRVPVHGTSPSHCAPLASAVPVASPVAPAAPEGRARFRELQVPSLAALMQMKRGNGARAAIAASMSSSLPAYGSPTPFRPKMRALPGRREARRPEMLLESPGADALATIAKFKFNSPLRVPPADTAFTVRRFQFRDPLDVAEYRASTLVTEVATTLTGNEMKIKKIIESEAEKSTDDVLKAHCKNSSRNDTFSRDTVEKKASSELNKKKNVELWNGNHDWKKQTEPPAINGDFKPADSIVNDAVQTGRVKSTDEPDKISDNTVSKMDSKPYPANSILAAIVMKQQQQWECSACMTGNDQNKIECVCCQTPKLKTPVPEVPPVKSGMASFIKKQQEQWQCDSCMTMNDKSLNKCVCCETPAPGSKPLAVPIQVPPYSGMASFIKKQQEQWECACCMTGNDRNRNKCACCEAPRPGCEPAPVESAKFNFGNTQIANSFKFGIDKANEVSIISDSMKSGDGEVQKKQETSATNTGFVFGNTFKPTDSTPNAGFQFGISNGKTGDDCNKTSTPPSKPELTFGLKPAPDSATPNVSSVGFSFGLKPINDSKSLEVLPAKTEKEASQIVPKSFLIDTKTDKAELTFGIPTGESKSVETLLGSSGPPVLTPVATSNTVDPIDKSCPPYMKKNFTFALQPSTPKTVVPATFVTSPFQFGSATSTASPSSVPTFKSTGGFNFGSKASPILPLSDSKPEDKLPVKSLFQMPSSPGTSLFPGMLPTLPAPIATSKEAQDDKTSNSTVQFSAPSTAADKPKDTATAAPFFSFSSPNANSGSNLFKTASSAAPLFSFGVPVAPKSDTTNLPIFGASSAKPQVVNLFGAKPRIEASPAGTDSLFKAAPATSPSSFAPAASNIFGSSTSVNSSLPSTNMFGSGALTSPTTKPAAVFGTPQLGTPAPSSSPFNSPAFGSTGIFGSSTAPVSSGGPFGTPSLKPAEGGFLGPAATAPTVFGAAPVAAPTQGGSGVFGSSPAVPTPVFGASVPFGETPSAGPAFKFGSGAAPPTFGSAGTSSGIFSFGGSAPVPQPSNSQFNFSMGAPSSAFPAPPGAAPGPAQRRIKKAVRRNVLR